eukprot:2064022-Rhodomonas_salina.1
MGYTYIVLTLLSASYPGTREYPSTHGHELLEHLPELLPRSTVPVHVKYITGQTKPEPLAEIGTPAKGNGKRYVNLHSEEFLPAAILQIQTETSANTGTSVTGTSAEINWQDMSGT